LPLINKLRKAKEENASLKLNITFSDDNSESGAMLTWKHVNPGIKPPMLVEYVCDGDLWKFAYGYDTNYFYSGLLANNRQPKEVPKDYWMTLMKDDVELNKVVELGSGIYGPYIEEVKSFFPFATEVILDGHKGYMVNASLKYKSELGNFLAQKNMTFGLVWEEKEDGMVDGFYSKETNTIIVDARKTEVFIHELGHMIYDNDIKINKKIKGIDSEDYAKNFQISLFSTTN